MTFLEGKPQASSPVCKGGFLKQSDTSFDVTDLYGYFSMFSFNIETYNTAFCLTYILMCIKDTILRVMFSHFFLLLVTIVSSACPHGHRQI